MFELRRVHRSFAASLSLVLVIVITSAALPVAQASPAPPATGAKLAAPALLNWSGAIDVSQASIALGPDVAMNRNEAQVAYTLGNTSSQEVYVAGSGDSAHSFAAGQFEGCAGGSTSGTSPIQVAEDNHRYVYVIWQDYCQNVRYLFFNRRDPAGNWAGARPLTNFNTNGGSIAVRNDGGVFISYVHVYTSGSDGQVEIIFSPDRGNTFNPAEQMNGRGQWTNVTTTAVDTSGLPHLAYEQGTLNNYQIYARDFVGGTWQAPVTIYSGRGFWPEMAANVLGGLGIVWQENDSNVDIYYKRWNPATAQWDSVPTNVSNSPINSLSPTLAYDNHGDAYIAWTESSSGGDLRVYYTYELSPGAFSTPQQIEVTRATAVHLASFNNNLTMTYQYDGSGNWRVYARWLSLPCTTPFTDIAGNVFAGAISYLYCAGAVNGNSSTTFNPGGTSTRGQFAKVVVLGFGITLFTPGQQHFTDVPPSYFAFPYIEAGYSAGVLGGYDANTCANYGAAYPCYLPNLAITRGQITKLVVVAAGYTIITPPTPSFSDVPTTNVFYSYIETAAAKHVVSGYPDGTFQPSANVRRDAMCQIVFAGINTP